jgi:hypothetical protein
MPAHQPAPPSCFAQDLQVENASLQSQLVQKTVELNNTLAEVLQLLDRGEAGEAGRVAGGSRLGPCALDASAQEEKQSHCLMGNRHLNLSVPVPGFSFS